jgi:hypothetical protein
MKHRLDIFLRVKTGDKGFKPFVVQFLKGAVSRSGGKVFMIAQYQAGFSGHNLFSVRYFWLSEKRMKYLRISLTTAPLL